MFKRLPDNFATRCLRGSGQVLFEANAATGGCTRSSRTRIRRTRAPG